MHFTKTYQFTYIGMLNVDANKPRLLMDRMLCDAPYTIVVRISYRQPFMEKYATVDKSNTMGFVFFLKLQWCCISIAINFYWSFIRESIGHPHVPLKCVSNAKSMSIYHAVMYMRMCLCVYVAKLSLRRTWPFPYMPIKWPGMKPSWTGLKKIIYFGTWYYSHCFSSIQVSINYEWSILVSVLRVIH